MKLNAFSIPFLDSATPPPPANGKNKQVMERIGLVLKTVRKSRGWSLAEVETLSGISHSTISRIESGTSEPGALTLVALECAYSLRPGWVLQTAA